MSNDGLAAVIVAGVLALGGVGAWLHSQLAAVRRDITASRHKTVADLTAAIMKIGEDVDDLGERIGKLETRVAVLEAGRAD